MKIATICFLLQGDEICLGLKKRGFGEGKYNGFGGKVGDKEEFKDETVEDSIIREGREEFEVEVRNLEKMGEMSFVFLHKPSWNHFVHVYICRQWNGEPKEGDEMRPVWFKMSDIPYKQMWDDDKYWLPKILRGENVKAQFEFDENGLVTRQEIQVVEKFARSSERK